VSGTALLDAVYAAPEDREARLVYGDWLLERGDPRGELIQLQLREPKTKAQAARETELVEAHAEEWIGRLTKITTWVELELGFLARCGLRDTPAWAIGMREWATVKHIGISDRWNTTFVPLVIDGAMTSLESVRLPERALGALAGATDRATRIRRLTVDGPIAQRGWEALVASRALAALAELDIRGAVDAPIWTSRFTRVAHQVQGFTLVWTRGDDGRLSAVAAEPGDLKWGRVPVIDDLLSYFTALPKDVIAAIDLTAVPKLPIKRAKHALRKQVRVVDDL